MKVVFIVQKNQKKKSRAFELDIEISQGVFFYSNERIISALNLYMEYLVNNITNYFII